VELPAVELLVGVAAWRRLVCELDLFVLQSGPKQVTTA